MTDTELKDYVDRQLCQQDKAWRQRFDDASTAIGLAKETIEHRLSGMNELREQINRERGTFVSRELFDRVGRELEIRVQELQDWRNQMVGRMWAVSVVLFIVQVATALIVFLRK